MAYFKHLLLFSIGLACTTSVFSLWSTEFASTPIVLLHLLSLAVLGVTLIGVSLLRLWERYWPPRWVTGIICPLFTAATFICVYLLPVSMPLAVTVALLGGLGMAPQVFGYGKLCAGLAGLGAKEGIFCVAGALILNHIFHALLKLPLLAGAYGLEAIFPLFAALCLFLLENNTVINRDVGSETQYDEEGIGSWGKQQLWFFVRFIVAMTIINFALSFTYNLYRMPEIIAISTSTLEIPTMLARVIVLIAISALFVFVHYRVAIHYRIIVILGTFGFLMFPLLGTGNVVPYVLTAAAYTCLGIMHWVFPAQFSSFNRIHPYSTIGFVYGFFVLLWPVTWLVLNQMVAPLTFDHTVLNTITLFGAGLIVVTYTLILNEREIQRATSIRSVLLEPKAQQEILSHYAETLADTYRLTMREREVLLLVIQDASRAEIMDDLAISEGTLNAHMSHIYQKLDVHNRRELRDKLRDGI